MLYKSTGIVLLSVGPLEIELQLLSQWIIKYFIHFIKVLYYHFISKRTVNMHYLKPNMTITKGKFKKTSDLG